MALFSNFLLSNIDSFLLFLYRYPTLNKSILIKQNLRILLKFKISVLCLHLLTFVQLNFSCLVNTFSYILLCNFCLVKLFYFVG